MKVPKEMGEQDDREMGKKNMEESQPNQNVQ